MKEYKFDLTDDQLNALKILGIEPKSTQTEEIDDQFPKYGDEYYAIDTFGEIKCTKYIDCKLDRSRSLLGNVFKTQEDAEFEVERLKVIAKMRKYVDVPVDDTDYASYIVYDHYTGNVSSTWSKDRLSNIRFSSITVANECIFAVSGDRIKKYYFGIKE